jgi:methylated-DNA-[protein]-cysteine S-methyltransferase
MIAVRQQVQKLYWGSIASPVGVCTLIATEKGLCWVGLPGTPVDEGVFRTKRWIPTYRMVRDEQAAPLRVASMELLRYFAGEKVQFACPLDLYGTPFQLQVWQQLCGIPYGETRSYREIAQAIGRPTASRAVGAANGANPVPVIVPCHRVLGSGGSLTGYAGGLFLKSWLLSLEGIRMQER